MALSTLIKNHPFEQSKAAFKNGIPEIVQRILLARDIFSEVDLEQRLSCLENPALMLGLDAAISILVDALQKQKKVLICGDYDADGATSTALIVRVLKNIGMKNIDFLVPNRFDFGYGLSVELVDVALQSFQPDLIITVDNGISSIEGISHARQNGIEVIVTDHHLPGNAVPNANAIVNPNQEGCEFPSKNLAGVGVVFYLLIALRAELRKLKWFEAQGVEEPKLEQYLDIVALGTVADVVVLDKLNRILVRQGLKLIKSGRGNAGIRHLFSVAGRELNNATSADLGFAIGPRINAAGRLDDITHGILCLLEDNEQQANQYALELHQINQDRRQIQDQMLIEADRALSKLDLASSLMPWGYCCYQEDWHQGLVGLVASKVKETLHRPVIAFAKADTAPELKGSARSIPGLHIRDCLELVSSQNPGLIKKFGGHAMAAGLSIADVDYEQFVTAFDQAVRSMINEKDLEQVVWIDGELDEQTLTKEFADYLENLLPWGQGISEPQFRGEFKVTEFKWLKETHLKLKVTRQDSYRAIDAIWFNAPHNIVQNKGDIFSAVYRLNINRYMGRETLQLMIVDGEISTI